MKIDIPNTGWLKISLWLFVGFLSVLQLLFAWYRYPLLCSDGIAFLPAALNYYQGEGLINNVYFITRLLNEPSPVAVFINYPPLYPLLNGYLLFITDNLHLNAALLHICLYYLATLIFWKLYFQRKPQISTLFFWSCFLLAWSTQLNPAIGRPEAMAELWMLLLIGNVLLNRNHKEPFISAALIAFTGFTHPVAGIYVLTLYGAYRMWKGVDWRQVIYLLTGAIAALLFIVLTYYPHSFTKMLEGIVRHGEMVAMRNEFSIKAFIHYHFTYPEISFYFPVFVLFLLSCGYLIKKSIQIARYPSLFLLAAGLFFMILFYFSFQTIEASYNLYVLFPLFGLVILHAYVQIKKRFLKYIVGGMLLLASVGFARRVMLFPIHITEGLSFTEARKILRDFPLEREKTFVSTSLYVLPDSQKYLTDDRNDANIEYILQQQNYTGQLEVPEIIGFQVVSSTYINKPVYWGPVKIASTPPGYQFALYKRKK